MLPNRPRLGAILVDQGVISRDELQAAVLYQLRAESVEGRTLLAEVNAAALGRRPCKHMRLGEVLVAAHLCTEAEIAQALAVQLKLPFFEVHGCPPAQDALAMIPADVAIDRGVLPVRIQNGVLTVAAAEPASPGLADSISEHAGIPVSIHCAAESEVRRLVQHYYSGVISPVRELAGAGAGVRQAARNGFAMPWQEDVERESGLSGGGTSIDIFNRLLDDAIRQGASDLYLEPGDDIVRAQVRVQGRLSTIANLSLSSLFGISTHVKMMSGMECCDPPVPQDGSCPVRSNGQRYRLNVSILPGMFGESIIVRLTQ